MGRQEARFEPGVQLRVAGACFAKQSIDFVRIIELTEDIDNLHGAAVMVHVRTVAAQ